jgi:hypothetical protein
VSIRVQDNTAASVWCQAQIDLRQTWLEMSPNLVSRGRRSLWWPLHQENKRNHHQSGQAQEPEIVEVCDHTRLPENGSVELPVRLMLGGDGAARREALAHSLHCVVELVAVSGGVSGQRGLMKLRTARQHCCDERNAHAGANVARQIDQA